MRSNHHWEEEVAEGWGETRKTTEHVGSLAKETFFELVDEVLLSVGRAPLSPGGHQRRVIEIGPLDRVLQILAGAGSGKA